MFNRTYAVYQSVIRITASIVTNLVALQDRAKHELLFKKTASALIFSAAKKKFHDIGVRFENLAAVTNSASLIPTKSSRNLPKMWPKRKKKVKKFLRLCS
jgi:hypothetical protein